MCFTENLLCEWPSHQGERHVTREWKCHKKDAGECKKTTNLWHLYTDHKCPTCNGQDDDVLGPLPTQNSESVWRHVPAGVKQERDTFVADPGAFGKVVKALKNAPDWYFFKTTAGLTPSFSKSSTAESTDGGGSDVGGSDVGVSLQTPLTPTKSHETHGGW